MENNSASISSVQYNDIFSASKVSSCHSREILEDSNFQQALHRIIDEPIPYFSQFSTRFSEDYLRTSKNTHTDGTLSQQCLHRDDAIPKTFSHRRKDSTCMETTQMPATTNAESIGQISSEDYYTSTLPLIK